ncbi:MAG TPA: endonuclease III [Planctomycetaceae bacterium]|nr:endonuclease III [Planctomycetaceae bacterium]
MTAKLTPQSPAQNPRPHIVPSRETRLQRRKRTLQIVDRLEELYPDADCSLRFKNPFELLISTILSAQCTDKRVNLVTQDLFKRWPSPHKMAAASIPELENAVKTTGFFRAKAKNIQGCCRKLVNQFNGNVPQTVEELISLPGVGRKTANVVLGSAFGLAEGVVVDTHVGRISRRLALTKAKDAVRAERDLVREIPQNHWVSISHRLIQHGRGTCLARKPRCAGCGLEDLCPRVGLPRHLKNSR